jgi:hypothetical protein
MDAPYSRMDAPYSRMDAPYSRMEGPGSPMEGVSNRPCARRIPCVYKGCRPANPAAHPASGACVAEPRNENGLSHPFAQAGAMGGVSGAFRCGTGAASAPDRAADARSPPRGHEARPLRGRLPTASGRAICDRNPALRVARCPFPQPFIVAKRHAFIPIAPKTLP